MQQVLVSCGIASSYADTLLANATTKAIITGLDRINSATSAFDSRVVSGVGALISLARVSMSVVGKNQRQKYRRRTTQQQARCHEIENEIKQLTTSLNQATAKFDRLKKASGITDDMTTRLTNLLSRKNLLEQVLRDLAPKEAKKDTTGFEKLRETRDNFAKLLSSRDSKLTEPESKSAAGLIYFNLQIQELTNASQVLTNTVLESIKLPQAFAGVTLGESEEKRKTFTTDPSEEQLLQVAAADGTAFDTVVVTESKSESPLTTLFTTVLPSVEAQNSTKQKIEKVDSDLANLEMEMEASEKGRLTAKELVAAKVKQVKVDLEAKQLQEEKLKQQHINEIDATATAKRTDDDRPFSFLTLKGDCKERNWYLDPSPKSVRGMTQWIEKIQNGLLKGDRSVSEHSSHAVRQIIIMYSESLKCPFLLAKVFDGTFEYDPVTGKAIATVATRDGKKVLISNETNKIVEPLCPKITDAKYEGIVWDQVYQYEKCDAKVFGVEIRKRLIGQPASAIPSNILNDREYML